MSERKIKKTFISMYMLQNKENQHILGSGAIIAGLILLVVIFLIVSYVGVDGMGVNDHRIRNYPIILKVWSNLFLLALSFPLV